jgi:chemotaxis protein MotA
MGSIVGVSVVLVMVFGGYLLAGGKMGIIMYALPFEMMIIGGAAAGAFMVSNDGATIEHTLKDVGKMVKGPKWRKDDYLDLLQLLFEIVRLAKQSPMAIEEHIEMPETSNIFQKYPRILADRAAIDLICDTLRSASMNYDDPHQVSEGIENDLRKQLQESMHSSHALQSMSDGLPALGIVAAVLGVIKTMASIDQPPEILGRMIGGALVGTFLGVFLSYGMVGPFSARIKLINEEDHGFYALIGEVLIAHLYQHQPTICIEVGRKKVPAKHRPRFVEVEETLRNLKAGAPA